VSVAKSTPVAKVAKAAPAKPVLEPPVVAKTKPAAKLAATPAPAKPAATGKAAPAKVVAVPAAPPPRSHKKTEPVTQLDETESVNKTLKTAKVAKAAEPLPVAKPAVASPQLTPLGVPVRSGRPSSRLAQLTVPSMAQSVASTAAKASFTRMSAVQPIVSPLASAVKKDPKLANNWKKKPVAELTDAEVLAMSDDDYMNDTQMAFFRLKLVVLKNDILSNAGETTEHLREDTVVVPDPADRATIEEEHALELRTRDRERKLLKKIEQSINRIDAGDYGYCDETGEPIGVGRLLARPTATLSLEAQQRRELKQKMFGD
jgi:DnaK suppressor protein